MVEADNVTLCVAWVRYCSHLEMVKCAATFNLSRLRMRSLWISHHTYYVDRTWINGDFHPTLWSHYDNLGPRMTNVVESWHNGLNSRFGMPHPSLRVFLDWLQKHQYEVQCRGIQLAAGRSPKPRRATYVTLECPTMVCEIGVQRRSRPGILLHFPRSKCMDALLFSATC